MNKKLIIGIVAGVVVLAACLITIFSLSGKLKFNFKGDKDNSSKITSSQGSSEKKDGSNSGAGETKFTGKETVEVKDATVSDGKITVPVYATKNDGMCATRLFIKYDTSKFDYANVKAGDIFDECNVNVDKGEIVIVATSSEGIADIKGAGTIVNVILIPKADTPKGEYKVTVDTEKSEFANYNGEFVHPEVEAGKIVIK